MSRRPQTIPCLRTHALPSRRSDSSTYTDSDSDEPPSSSSSDSSIDEEEFNKRIIPHWPSYRATLKQRGFQLDTVRDVKLQHGPQAVINSVRYLSLYRPSKSGENMQDDDALCPDAGLPENLFRGLRTRDRKRIVVKAVHIGSREHHLIRVLSSPPLVNEPLNHTIPVLDLFEVPTDNIAFIVMEEWSSQLITESGSCCLMQFLSALRQCIEHALFLHRHRIAHLDISLHNLVTDFHGRYAYIDYELSRRFEVGAKPLVCQYRGTEIPPECESRGPVDAFKVDIWALAVLILRASKLTGFWVPELMTIVQPMLHEDPNQRPPLTYVLPMFDKIVACVRSKPSKSTCHY